MPKITFLLTFLCAQLLFVFLLIHKSSQFIKESYQKQKIELTKGELIHKKEMLTNQIYAVKNPAAIKKFAQTELHLEPVKLSQIKRISPQEPPVPETGYSDANIATSRGGQNA